jgi:hypothetical protein
MRWRAGLTYRLNRITDHQALGTSVLIALGPFREFVHDSVKLDIDDVSVGGLGSKARRLRHFWSNHLDYVVGKLLKDLVGNQRREFNLSF